MNLKPFPAACRLTNKFTKGRNEMIRPIATIVILASMICLAACGGEANPIKETKTEAAAPANPAACTAALQSNEASFKAELSIDLKSYQDRLKESDAPALEVLEKNLTALVEHDHARFRSGFVNEKLADAMEFYYGEPIQYKFTGIETIDQNSMNPHQVNITVTGQRLDTTAGTVEDIKMLYAIRPDDQGEWRIYTID